MRVLLLSQSVTPSGAGLRAALERAFSVSDIDMSEIRSAGDGDILIATEVAAAEVIASRPESAPWFLIVVARPTTPEERVKLLDDGADVVLHGAVPDDEIVAQVRAIARRSVVPFDQVGRRSPPQAKVRLDVDHRHVMVLGRSVTLTRLEGDLLAAFIARPEEVLNSAALLTSVWGSPFGARSTVSAYVRRLRVKIEPDPCHPVFIRTVWGGGYVFRPDGRR